MYGWIFIYLEKDLWAGDRTSSWRAKRSEKLRNVLGDSVWRPSEDKATSKFKGKSGYNQFLYNWK